MDKSTRQKLAVFMHAFESVFREDWQYAQSVLMVNEMVQNDDFLKHGQYTDWAGHEALVSAYEDLKKELGRLKISIEELGSDGMEDT